MPCNSKYVMMESVLYCLNEINEIAHANPSVDKAKGKYLLSKDEADLSDQIWDLLAPFHEMTETLSAQKYPTISFLYPTIYFMRFKFLPNVKYKGKNYAHKSIFEYVTSKLFESIK